MTDAEIWCALNKHEWPPELGDKPDDDKAIWARMCEIQDRIGMKECLREWNRENMPGEAFDEWWESRRPYSG